MVDYSYGFLRQVEERIIDSNGIMDGETYAGNIIFIETPSDITITLPSASMCKLSKFTFVRKSDVTGSVTIDTIDTATITIRDITNGLSDSVPSISSPAGFKAANVELISDGVDWIGTGLTCGWS